MDKNRAFLLWLAGAAGVVLLYAAYKGKSPTELLSTYAADPAPTSNPGSGPHITTATPAGSDHVSADFTSDMNGFTVPVPAAYKNSPGTFIPSPYDNG